MKRVPYTLRQLEYFVAVAEAGTISEAAARLHVSQPGLSTALTELEHVLGAQLTIRRRSHGVTLTPTGSEVLRQARQVLRQAEDLAGLAAGGDALAGTLFLGCYVTLAPSALPPLLQGFVEQHPGVDIDFVEDTQDVLQRRLGAGELDLAVLYDMELDPALRHEVVAAVRPHVLLPAAHPMAAQDRVSLAELATEPQILLDAPPSSRNTLKIFKDLGIDPRVTYRPRTYELTRALVGRGLGYALLVQRPANDRTYEGKRVVIREIAEKVPESRVVVAWPAAMRLNPRAEAFVAFCRSPQGARV